jgi:hypothetical protein
MNFLRLCSVRAPVCRLLSAVPVSAQMIRAEFLDKQQHGAYLVHIVFAELAVSCLVAKISPTGHLLVK